MKEKLTECDDEIIALMTQRMKIMEEIAHVQKHVSALLQPGLDEFEENRVKEKLSGHPYHGELLRIYQEISDNSRKIQARILFPYNIFLIGFMGTGKSTIAGCLSRMLGLEQIEMDSSIEQQQQMKITQIFEEQGEAYFRDLESELLMELQKKKQLIVSCGGGAVLRPLNVEHMKRNGRIVWLTATAETVYSRVKDSTDRPVLNHNMNVQFISELMEKRRELYQSAADLIVQTDGKSAAGIAQEVMLKLLELDLQS